ncbi:MAG: peptidylprolyl isomerase [Elusimicrobia bacterium]|nr:peptidylprolyl isomerase [Elusimicrobiota bacterium]
MANINKKFFIVPAAVLAMSAAYSYSKEINKMVAKINGEPIMSDEYEKNKNMITEQYKNAMPDFFKQPGAKEQIEEKVLDQMVDDILLKQKAESLKIKVYDREIDQGVAEIKKRFAFDETGKALGAEEAEKVFNREIVKENFTMLQFRDRIKNQLVIKKLMDEVIRPRVKMPVEEQVRNYFDKIILYAKGDAGQTNKLSEEEQEIAAIANKFKEAAEERVRVRHVLIKLNGNASMAEKTAALKKAKDIKKELDAGADFEELAQKYSQDGESAKRGGDLGYAIRGMLPKKFEEKAFSMQVGEITELVETEFGYHIIKLEEKRARQKIKFELVKDDIEEFLTNREFRNQLVALVKELREKANIQKFTP